MLPPDAETLAMEWTAAALAARRVAPRETLFGVSGGRIHWLHAHRARVVFLYWAPRRSSTTLLARRLDERLREQPCILCAQTEHPPLRFGMQRGWPSVSAAAGDGLRCRGLEHS